MKKYIGGKPRFLGFGTGVSLSLSDQQRLWLEAVCVRTGPQGEDVVFALYPHEVAGIAKGRNRSSQAPRTLCDRHQISRKFVKGFLADLQKQEAALAAREKTHTKDFPLVSAELAEMMLGKKLVRVEYSHNFK